MSLPRTIARLTLGTGVAAGLLMAAAPALAHVTISPDTAEPGGYGVFDVRVPNEESDADTTKIELYLPADHPIASVSVQPTPGWKVHLTEKKLTTPIKTHHGTLSEVVSTITWSGGTIAPGRFQRFGISLGPLPTDVDTLYFKALQTYTDHDGHTSVTRWIQIPSGDTEPDHPAPSVTLRPATAAPTHAATATTGDTDGETTTATALGAAGLAAGILALALSVVAVRRSRTGRDDTGDAS